MTMRFLLAALFTGWLCVDAVVAMGVIGRATSYNPPYIPTKCPGYSSEQFPENGLIAAVSQALWDNGAACGRKYQIQCLSGPGYSCKNDATEVEIVDLCDPCPAMMALSNIAFEKISRTPNATVGINFAQ
ncbi:EG45-like domain containing protein [Magnolia sinica]|uniref:EG45-like domain containing protein n=1 Tax=Magnolia sinica TaxID=86752 RepID=UPI00265AD680|nr:EG45-like domain containing protein [Magnolia sinica]